MADGLNRRTAILFSAVFGWRSAHAQKQELAYSPLAIAILIVPRDAIPDVLKRLRKFANDNNIQINGIPIPADHLIQNFTIPVGEDSFFVFNNVTSEQEFNLIAYSHESPQIWTSLWRELIAALSALLGQDRIRITKEPM